MNTIKMILGGLVGLTLLVGCTAPVETADEDTAEASEALQNSTPELTVPHNSIPGKLGHGAKVSAPMACNTMTDLYCGKIMSACTQDSECYAFKACYEDVQTDSAAVQACVEANPVGAKQWASVVQCVCRCDEGPALFCDGSKFGHPNG